MCLGDYAPSYRCTVYNQTARIPQLLYSHLLASQRILPDFVTTGVHSYHKSFNSYYHDNQNLNTRQTPNTQMNNQIPPENHSQHQAYHLLLDPPIPQLDLPDDDDDDPSLSLSPLSLIHSQNALPVSSTNPTPPPNTPS